MQTIPNITVDDLKQMIMDLLKETLSEKRLKDIFYEVLEDISLSKAIDEGMKSDTIDKTKFIKKLKSRFQ